MTHSEQQSMQQQAAQLMGQGKVTAARTLLKTLINQYPNDWLSRVQLAEILESEGQFTQALELIQQALAVEPGHLPTRLKLHAKLALVAQHAEDFVLARSHYTLAIDGDPASFGRFRLSLGNCCYAMGDFSAAVLSYQQHLAHQPDHTQCRTHLAMALERLFQYDEALSQWRELSQREPQNPRWPTLQGALELHRENLSGAEVALLQAAELGADDAIFFVNQASLLFEQGRYEQSLEVLAKHPELAGRQDIEQLQFLNRFQTGRFDQCIQQSQEIVKSGQREMAMVALSLLPQVLLELDQASVASEANNFQALLSRQRLMLDKAEVARLEQHIVEHPSLTFEPVTTSTHNGSQTQSLLIPGSNLVTTLVDELRRRVTSYADHARATATAYASLIPDAGRIKIWAVALSSGGYQGSHMHPHGIISGVFYLKVPVGGDPDAGALELGCPEAKFHRSKEPLVSVEPVTSGDLLIFPSWCFHRTLPFSSSEQRISIAFDVVPPDSPEWNDPGLSPPFLLTAKPGD